MAAQSCKPVPVRMPSGVERQALADERARAANIVRVAARPPELVEAQLALCDAVAAAERAGGELVGSIARHEAEDELRAARARHDEALAAIAEALFAVRESALAQSQSVAILVEQGASDGVRAQYLEAILRGDAAKADELEPLVPPEYRVLREARA